MGNQRFRKIWESMWGGVIFHDIVIPTNGFRGMLKWEGCDIIADDFVGAYLVIG